MTSYTFMFTISSVQHEFASNRRHCVDVSVRSKQNFRRSHVSHFRRQMQHGFSFLQKQHGVVCSAGALHLVTHHVAVVDLDSVQQQLAHRFMMPVQRCEMQRRATVLQCTKTLQTHAASDVITTVA